MKDKFFIVDISIINPYNKFGPGFKEFKDDCPQFVYNPVDVKLFDDLKQCKDVFDEIDRYVRIMCLTFSGNRAGLKIIEEK